MIFYILAFLLFYLIEARGGGEGIVGMKILGTLECSERALQAAYSAWCHLVSTLERESRRLCP